MFRWLLTAALLVAAQNAPGAAQSPAASGSSSDQTPASLPAASDSAPKSVPPKKVWTNDNLARTGGGVSVVGDKGNQKSTATPARPADAATVSRIRESLAKLEAQLEAVNPQLASFKRFEQGETISKGTDEIKSGYTRMPVNQQMSVLEDKRKKLETQIDALSEEARKKGIEPGQLR